MAKIEAQRRYWAYEDITMDMDEVLKEFDDEEARRAAPYLSDVHVQYCEEGGLEIGFSAPDGTRYQADVYAVSPSPFALFPDWEETNGEAEGEANEETADEGAEEEDDEEDEDDEEAPYSWMVEIHREGQAPLADYDAPFYQPPKGEPIRIGDTMGVLVAIAEAVYAESDQDHGSPHSILGDDYFAF
ncbi:MAG TPA: hypothetical protein VFA07_00665 [Chthonomonadaceae bacterium]|nr:hypothetical protein [Chthonomonadaceae bacterium]